LHSNAVGLQMVATFGTGPFPELQILRFALDDTRSGAGPEGPQIDDKVWSLNVGPKSGPQGLKPTFILEALRHD
jgi:hypothetical protein